MRDIKKSRVKLHEKVQGIRDYLDAVTEDDKKPFVGIRGECRVMEGNVEKVRGRRLKVCFV